MSPTPLLTLVMIVKDEAKSLRRTLESVRGAADRALILDTGSNDGTQDLARKLFEGVLPGTMYEEPFVDFATTRNRSLELCTGQSVFALVLSGDETLVDAPALRAFCEKHRDAKGPEHGAYFLPLELAGMRFDSPRLVRLSEGWRFQGVVHEILCKDGVPPPSIRVPGAHIHHDLAGRDPERKRRGWERDLELLRAEQRKHPNDARTAFYFAQTLEDLNRFHEAHAAYQERIALGGWREELYEARYRLARTGFASGMPWPQVQQLYLDAFTFAPHRAEPLFAIALYWQQQGNHALAYLFGQRAMQLPYPEQDTLFVRRDIYEHLAAEVVGASAWYIGEYTVGVAALERALAVRPGAPELLRNLEFYRDKLPRH